MNPGSNSSEENDVLPGESGDDDIMSNNRDSLGSEDDHDPAWLQVFDLALRKTTMEVVAYPGLVAKFMIEVINQGNMPATNILVKDFINAGYIYHSDSDAEGWMQNADTAEFLISDVLMPNEVDTLCLFLEVHRQSVPGLVDK